MCVSMSMHIYIYIYIYICMTMGVYEWIRHDWATKVGSCHMAHPTTPRLPRRPKKDSKMSQIGPKMNSARGRMLWVHKQTSSNTNDFIFYNSMMCLLPAFRRDAWQVPRQYFAMFQNIYMGAGYWFPLGPPRGEIGLRT